MRVTLKLRFWIPDVAPRTSWMEAQERTMWFWGRRGLIEKMLQTNRVTGDDGCDILPTWTLTWTKETTQQICTFLYVLPAEIKDPETVRRWDYTKPDVEIGLERTDKTTAVDVWLHEDFACDGGVDVRGLVARVGAFYRGAAREWYVEDMTRV